MVIPGLFGIRDEAQTGKLFDAPADPRGFGNRNSIFAEAETFQYVSWIVQVAEAIRFIVLNQSWDARLVDPVGARSRPDAVCDERAVRSKYEQAAGRQQGLKQIEESDELGGIDVRQ